MKNIKETVTLPAGIFLKSPLTPKTLSILSEAPNIMDSERDKNRLIQSLTPKNIQELQELGVQAPNNPVSASITLGSALFDMYVFMTPPPQAPLAQMAYQKNALRLMARLEQDEFELDKQLLGKIRTCMSDDDIWNKAKFTVKINDNKAVTVTSKIFSFFPKIINSLVNCLGDEDETASRQTGV